MPQRWEHGLCCAVLLVSIAGCAARSPLQRPPSRQECRAPEGPATLGDYWEGRAAWRLVRKYPAQVPGNPYGEGAHVFVHRGAWYLFSRKLDRVSPPPSYCPQRNFATMGVELRQSMDQGLTWSDPMDVVVPTLATPWECAATDGDVTFDPGQNRWRYLFQCMDRSRTWNGCSVERNATEPMGPWQTAPGGGIAVHGGELWSRICVPGTVCATLAGETGRIAGEGTFNFFSREEGGVFVSFHGYDGVRGYRGVARWNDSGRWSAGQPGSGTPADAIFTANDTRDWREQWNGASVGGGGGAILREDDGYYYLIVEAADINLGCTPGQNWDVGLLRTRDLTSLPWEQFPLGNPIFYSDPGHRVACSPSYNRIFRDGAVRYLTHHRIGAEPSQDALYLYRLVASDNRLRNADLWRCDTDSWQVRGLQVAVPRDPAVSADGGCSLELSCAPSGCAGGEVFQDLDASDLADRMVSFGGSFLSDGAPLGLVLTQRDAAGSVIGSSRVEVGSSTSYATASSVTRIAPATRSLRLAIVLAGVGQIRADELFVTPCGVR